MSEASGSQATPVSHDEMGYVPEEGSRDSLPLEQALAQCQQKAEMVAVAGLLGRGVCWSRQIPLCL